MNIEHRIELLERQNRRLKYILGGLAMVVAVGFSIGQTKKPSVPKEVRAEQFVLVNKTGRILASLRSHKDGAASLFIGNVSGGHAWLRASSEGGEFVLGKQHSLVSLNASEDGGDLYLSSLDRKHTTRLKASKYRGGLSIMGNKNTQINMGVYEDNSTFYLAGPDWSKRVSLRADLNNAGVTVSASSKKPCVAMLATNQGGIFSISDNDANNSILALMGKNDNHTGGQFSIYNKTGEVVCRMNVDAYGNGEVGAWDRKGMGRTLTPGP